MPRGEGIVDLKSFPQSLLAFFPLLLINIGGAQQEVSFQVLRIQVDGVPQALLSFLDGLVLQQSASTLFESLPGLLGHRQRLHGHRPFFLARV